MKEDGYTLVEMLVALAIIGLVLGGLFEGMHVAGRMQATAGRALVASQARRAVREGLTSFLAQQGPFRSDRTEAFVGAAETFHFACGDGATCMAGMARMAGGLRLSMTDGDGTQRTALLPGVEHARFTYAGSRTVEDAWPIKSLEPQTLRSVSLLADEAGDAPIATVRLWSEQDIACEYDVISRLCRDIPK